MTDGRFDPAEDEANLAAHGVSLAFGARVFEGGDHLIIPSIRPIDGEERFKAVGLVDGRMFTVVFTWRDDLHLGAKEQQG